jgi:RNA polymerase sigma-70 factor, ECF subfamily
MERLAVELIGLARRPAPDAGVSMNFPGELIARARRGDEDAFRLIFERYTRPLISFIFYMVDRRDLAEELAQETFLRAYQSLESLRDAEKLSQWLFGIARNVAREALRSRGREPHSVEMDDPAVAGLSDDGRSPAGKLLDKELSFAVRSALSALDEDKRLVFTLKVYQQRSYEEICAITGFSLPKVRNDLYRARIEMRRRLRHYVSESK